jgi:hypothetical protein
VIQVSNCKWEKDVKLRNLASTQSEANKLQ